MRYLNAADILPPSLLKDLQRYAAGKQLYVPLPAARVGWGERSGARAELSRRNETIRHRHAEGATVEELMTAFHLSYDSIRKIIGGKNGSNRSRG